MDIHSFLRALDDRPLLGGLNGLKSLNTFCGLNIDPSVPVDVRGKGRVAREEAALQALIVQTINDGDWDSLKPNSGTAVNVGDHYLCVSYNEDHQSGCRVWEWHGHLLIFCEESGFSPEYTYGNYFQHLESKKDDGSSDETDVRRGTKSGEKVARRIGLCGIINENEGQLDLVKHRQQDGFILHRLVKKDRTHLSWTRRHPSHVSPITNL
ncbi:hypothetical protein KP509_25G013100 [Ceratopteris richardii]|uniref:Uncharacterized protein n=1 Tax=Ceratopteris richardii TaxID=49495 RepID=A0A8T2RQS3_CERRI|nr:hypothetical protein KP509_25G013100 [Ceratopteris richardii]